MVQRNISGPSRPRASRHARRCPTMRDGRWGGAGAGRRNRPAARTVWLPGPDDPSGPDHPRRPDRRSRRARLPRHARRQLGGPSRPAPRPSPLDNTSKVILGVSEWGVWGLWGGVCPNLLHGRSVAGSGASGAQGPDPILAPWEDRSGPRPGCVRRFPHDCAVLTASQSGAPRNDPPGAPCSAPGGAARSGT